MRLRFAREGVTLRPIAPMALAARSPPSGRRGGQQPEAHERERSGLGNDSRNLIEVDVVDADVPGVAVDEEEATRVGEVGRVVRVREHHVRRLAVAALDVRAPGPEHGKALVGEQDGLVLPVSPRVAAELERVDADREAGVGGEREPPRESVVARSGPGGHREIAVSPAPGAKAAPGEGVVAEPQRVEGDGDVRRPAVALDVAPATALAAHPVAVPARHVPAAREGVEVEHGRPACAWSGRNGRYQKSHSSRSAQVATGVNVPLVNAV